MTDSTQLPDRRALLHNALQAIEDLQAKLAAVERARTEPIAIIGLSCRVPGATDPEAFWELLRAGRDVVGPAPADRWNLADFSDQNIAWYGGFLDRIDGFDPQFFGITPREANSIDPQQRLVLEVGWEALERAGIAPDRLAGSQTGVFIGVTLNDYSQLAKAGGPDQMDLYTATGSALNAVAGRLAYTLGLQGPCLVIDTACSSSLVALHLACQSLRNGESDLALAGGVNTILTPDAFVCFSKWGMMAPDGRCKTFDAQADGFVRGEGCGIVVLKRLSDALADHDPILALIRGSAVNQDGHSSGLTVPNGLAQQAVIRRALKQAGVGPHEISYVEAHGTGTALGDPIEIEALGAALGPGRDERSPLMVGSVKTNLGHLESASGITGLIKVVLSLQHAEIPPHLHLQTRSPRIPWPNFPIVIPDEPTPWPRSDHARLAGVSGFGFSGTNAHVIIEEAPTDSDQTDGPTVDRSTHVLTLSAKTEPALHELADRLARGPIASLADTAYTTNTGRARFAHRLAVSASSADEARDKLTAFAAGQLSSGVIAGHATSRPKIAFLFTGQGAQYLEMGCQLYETQPTFRAALDRCDEILRPYLGQSLLSVLYPESAIDKQRATINETAFTQPALFALEYALAELWKSWGIRPTAVMGHSVGEYVAACVAGVISLEDGLKLIAERGRLMQTLPQNGEMVAVFADEATVATTIVPFSATVSIAAVNGPENIVISGLRADVQTVVDQFTARGIQSKRLTVSHAFHSPLMRPILDNFERTAATVHYADPQIDLISNVTGRRLTANAISAPYWRDHILAPVQFAQSISTLRDQGYTAFIEIGPHPTLLSMARRCVADTDLLWLPSLRSGREDWPQVLESLSTLWVHGAEVDWAGFDRDYQRRRVILPTYPFQRQHYWLPAVAPVSPAVQRQHPLLGTRIDLASTPGVHVWEGEINTQLLPYLDDHRVQDVPIVPAAAYMEMVLAAAAQAFDAQSFTLTEMKFHKPITLPDGANPSVQVVLTEAVDRTATAQVFSRSRADSNWILNTTSQLHYGPTVEMRCWTTAEIDAIKARCTTELSGEEFYRLSSTKGNQWGPAFQGVQRIWRGDREALSRVEVPATLQPGLDRYVFHPAVSDACGHVITATIPLEKSAADKGGAFVGGRVDETRVYTAPHGQQFWAYARLRSDAGQPSNVLIGDIQVIDEQGRVVSETLGTHLWYLDQTAPISPQSIDDWLYEIHWEPAVHTRSQLTTSTPGTWLILSDSGGVGEQLTASLRARGERAIQLMVGMEYARLGEDQFCVRSDQREDLRQVVNSLVGQGAAAWRGIVHLWSLDAPPLTDNAALERAQKLNVGSVLHLIQSIAPIDWREFPRIWLVTRGAQPVVDSQPAVAVGQTSVWGLGRTLALEHSELWGGLIDLDATASPLEAAHDLLSEIVDRSREDQIAFRGGQRYVARLVRQARSAMASSSFQLSDQASYLITGGLGGLGLQVAHWLAQRGARHLVLMGRTPLPPRADWARVEAGSRPAQQIAVIQKIESLGATVHLAAVDVADEAQLQSFLTAYQAAQPAIQGVIHAAGILRHQSLIDCDDAALNEVLRAKVAGGWHLQQVLGAQLDFFVMFSSASALLSSPRLGSYAAANAFLDGLAHYRRANGQSALSVNWGVWADEGMVGQFEADDVAQITLRGMGTLSTPQGLEALHYLMHQMAAQVGVLPVNWRRWQELYPAFVDAPFLAHVVQRTKPAGATTPAGQRPALSRERLMAAAVDERTVVLQTYLSSLAAKTMGLTTLDPQQPLNELGLDSLMAVEIKNRIESDLGVVVPLVKLLQGPSLVQLTEHVLGQAVAFEAPAPPKVAPQVDEQMQAQQLMAQLDQLSDEQVDKLLNELLASQGNAHG